MYVRVAWWSDTAKVEDHQTPVEIRGRGSETIFGQELIDPSGGEKMVGGP